MVLPKLFSSFLFLFQCWFLLSLAIQLQANHNIAYLQLRHQPIIMNSNDNYNYVIIIYINVLVSTKTAARPQLAHFYDYNYDYSKVAMTALLFSFS